MSPHPVLNFAPFYSRPSVQILSAIGIAFWLWALYECYENETQRGKWFFILLIGTIPAAIVYAFVRLVPKIPAVARLLRRNDVKNAEFEATHIGGAYHYGRLGKLYAELGELKKARTAFETAIKKDPKEKDALWGLANLCEREGNFAAALTPLQQLWALDPAFKMGDAAVMYAQVLIEQERNDDAEKVLTDSFSRGNSPLARYLYATIKAKKGDSASARQHLEHMLDYMREAPPAEFRRYSKWVTKAQKLLQQVSPPK